MGEAAGSSPILLSGLRTVSPSSAELLRLCFLRAFLAASRDVKPFVLGSPKAWLGTAYHEVIEKIGAASHPSGAAAAASELWHGAVRRLWRKAQNHPLNRRFGPPETWPGYHLALAGAMLNCQNVASEPGHGASERTANHADDRVRERYLTANGGRLVGKPDLFSRCEVVDYKSGNIFEDGSRTEVKAGYVRQLRLYAYLVHSTHGYWPKRGVLVPMLGQRVEIELAPSDCESEAGEAVSLLETANSRLHAAECASSLASPSSRSCAYCPYTIICRAFWQAAKAEWAGELRQVCLEGALVAAPAAVHGGAAASVEVDVVRGTSAQHRTVIGPLNKDIHPCLAGGWQEGTLVRFTGLAPRGDVQPSPCAFTVCAQVNRLPELLVTPPDADSSAVPRDGT